MSCLLAICLSIGVTANTYADLGDTQSFKFKAGNQTYLWSEFENQRVKVLGQGLNEPDMYSFGVGFKETYKKIDVFLEAGWTHIEGNPSEFEQQEVVYTFLVGRHNVHNRPVPVKLKHPYDQDSYSTVYDLEGGFMGRLGVSYPLTNSIDLSLSYKFFTAAEHMAMWDNRREQGTGGWWEETNGRDLSTWGLGISYEF
jgi:opacity protein-like surface antigen